MRNQQKKSQEKRHPAGKKGKAYRYLYARSTSIWLVMEKYDEKRYSQFRIK
jgi:hypothetical protein